MTSFEPGCSSPSRVKPADGTEAALALVRRLLHTLQNENAEVRLNRGLVDHSEYNVLKSQALLALNRCAPKLAYADRNPALQTALQEVIVELETNRRLLATKLRAAQAVAATIARAIREAQSDGTYTRNPPRGGVP